MRNLVLMLAGVSLLGACAAFDGRLSVRDAEERCAGQAELADGFRGEARAGVTTNGPAGGLRLTVTSDILDPKDPEIVYDNCVFQLSGQGPTRPLALVNR